MSIYDASNKPVEHRSCVLVFSAGSPVALYLPCVLTAQSKSRHQRHEVRHACDHNLRFTNTKQPCLCVRLVRAFGVAQACLHDACGSNVLDCASVEGRICRRHQDECLLMRQEGWRSSGYRDDCCERHLWEQNGSLLLYFIHPCRLLSC